MSGKVGSLGLGKTARSWTKLDKTEKDYFFMVHNVKNPTEYRRYLGKFGMKVRK